MAFEIYDFTIVVDLLLIAVLCYKIVFGITWINKDDFFEVCCTSTRGHPYKLYKPFSGCRARTSFFCMRVVNIWNDLPVNVVDVRTLLSFKRTMSKHVIGCTITPSQFNIIVSFTTLALLYFCLPSCVSCVLCFIVCITSSIGPL